MTLLDGSPSTPPRPDEGGSTLEAIDVSAWFGDRKSVV